jgi:outer membrane protein
MNRSTNRYAACLLIFWLAPAAGNLAAQSPPAAAATVQPNIATISFNALVLQTNEAQRDLGALQTKFAPRQAQLQSLNSEIETARKQLSDTADKLSDQEKEARTQALNTKEKQLEREADDFRTDSESEAQQAFQRVAQKVFVFLQDYAREHRYAAIIDRGTDAAPIVWYAADNIDITADLIKAYNAKSGVPAPPPAVNPTPPNAPAGTPSKPSLPQTPQP